MSSTIANPLVVFDLGNVLIRIADDWAHACRVANVEIGSSWPMDEARRRALHEIVVANEIGRLDHEQFCISAGEVFGLDAKQVAAACDAYLIAPISGVEQLLDTLAAKKIETACLSNTNINHWRLMSSADGHASLPLDKLTHRFASQEIGARKPDDAVYEHVEQATKRAPEQIVFFDDNLDNVATALRRGWRVTRIDPTDVDPIQTIRRELASFDIL